MSEITNRFNALAERMENLPAKDGVALAVSVTQRLMDHYLAQPENRRSSFVAYWAEMMPVVWRMVLHPSAELKRTLKRKLKEYIKRLLGPRFPRLWSVSVRARCWLRVHRRDRSLLWQP